MEKTNHIPNYRTPSYPTAGEANRHNKKGANRISNPNPSANPYPLDHTFLANIHMIHNTRLHKLRHVFPCRLPLQGRLENRTHLGELAATAGV
jgi:hypothetical protein